jgi:hypothetical protein
MAFFSWNRAGSEVDIVVVIEILFRSLRVVSSGAAGSIGAEEPGLFSAKKIT